MDQIKKNKCQSYSGTLRLYFPIGFESYIIYLIQIENCKSFGIASDIDQEYFRAFKEASEKNVKMFCYDCKFSSKGIEINNEIKNLFNDR